MSLNTSNSVAQDEVCKPLRLEVGSDVEDRLRSVAKSMRGSGCDGLTSVAKGQNNNIIKKVKGYDLNTHC